jgi:hypothetical protein
MRGRDPRISCQVPKFPTLPLPKDRHCPRIAIAQGSLLPKARHCEERSDEAIQGGSTVRAALDCRAAKWRLAMTTVNIRGSWY